MLDKGIVKGNSEVECLRSACVTSQRLWKSEIYMSYSWTTEHAIPKSVKLECIIAFNYFVSYFRTTLFSQCHICFNKKEHNAMCRWKLYLQNLTFLNFFFQKHFKNIPNLSYQIFKILLAKQNVCKQRDFQQVRQGSKSLIGNVDSLLCHRDRRRWQRKS